MPTSITLPQLPVSFMNEDHEHARHMLERMMALLSEPGTDAGELGKACRAFLEHNREHFGREEAAMQATGFPPYPVHQSEHTNALSWLERLAVQAETAPESESLRRAILDELPAWYLRHIQTMDAVTANWIDAHSTG